MKRSDYAKLTPDQQRTRVFLSSAHDEVSDALGHIRMAASITGEFELDGLSGLAVSLANQIQAYIDRMERSIHDGEAVPR